MTESEFQRLIMIEASKVGARLFRVNTGQGWTGTVVECPQAVALSDKHIIFARPLHAGLCKGGSDLIGWTTDGRFIAVEVKSASGRLTPEQANFLEQVNKAGGIGICARSVEEVLCRLK